MKELKHNAWIWDVIAAEQYRDAFYAVREYEKLPANARNDTSPPSGIWVERVNKNRARLVRAKMAEKKRLLEELKRGRNA